MKLRILRYRVVLDFTVHIDEITDERIHESYRGLVEEDEAHWDWMNRQRRLLQALLEDEHVLAEFLSHVLTHELDYRLDVELVRRGEFKEDEEILEPVYSRMGGDVKHFGDARRHGFFSEYIELVRDSFVVDWDETKLVELLELKKISLAE